MWKQLYRCSQYKVRVSTDEDDMNEKFGNLNVVLKGVLGELEIQCFPKIRIMNDMELITRNLLPSIFILLLHIRRKSCIIVIWAENFKCLHELYNYTRLPNNYEVNSLAFLPGTYIIYFKSFKYFKCVLMLCLYTIYSYFTIYAICHQKYRKEFKISVNIFVGIFLFMGYYNLPHEDVYRSL